MITDHDNLVSCIMPTHNRRQFVLLAIQYFLRQDYEPKELIIVDDGTDAIGDLVPADDRIRYIRLEKKLTVGAKRNLACEQARGEIIVHWDDDDWHASYRLSYQVANLLKEQADICGLNRVLFFDPISSRAWEYVYPNNTKRWVYGATLCYTRAFWGKNPFPSINIAEDSRFVWNSHTAKIVALQDNHFIAALVHNSNTSPKQTNGAYWKPHTIEAIKHFLGDDWPCYQVRDETDVASRSAIVFSNQQTVTPIRNFFVCLVHENQECIIDMVRNLRYHDPSSIILLYNGSTNKELLNHHFPFDRYGAVPYPSPRPMRWGWLHDFAIDCMQFALNNYSFDTLTIVDSDQLGVRCGYSQYLGHLLSGKSAIGMLCNSPAPQPSTTAIAPAIQAWKEVELWRPFLRRFAQGEEKFVHWSFWPSTVFTADAARDLTELFTRNEHLKNILSRTRIWASEEVILPTLVALLGYKIVANPCNYDYVKYRARYSTQQIDTAMTRSDVFWIHPIPRRYDDSLRNHIRIKSNNYERSFSEGGVMPKLETNPDPALLLTWPILTRMKKIDGWLEEDEADLLIAVTSRMLTEFPGPHTIVEVGSYCGRSTVVFGSVVKAISRCTKIYSIDPHDGRIGALDQGIRIMPSTLEKFRRHIADTDLIDVVELIQKHSFEVSWEKPISLLFIDGLHDYVNVARDFCHFEFWVIDGGYIAFHDYADYYPGVKTFVNELLGSGRYQKVHRVRSMMLIKKISIVGSRSKS